MDIELTPIQARVMGVLMEKERSTPGYYPLTLNALTNACNQTTNRNPVMDVDEKAVDDTLESLLRKQLIWRKKSSDSRVLKFAHRIETIAEFSDKECGVICVLLLRGLQTVGEIRGRSRRLCSFESLADTQETLHVLAAHEKGPFVVKLPREVGRRERRYAHLFCGPVEIDEDVAEPGGPTAPGVSQRISALETEVKQLREKVDALEQALTPEE